MNYDELCKKINLEFRKIKDPIVSFNKMCIIKLWEENQKK